MASKKEVFETVSKEVNELCAKSKVPTNFIKALNVILASALEPKASGASVNIDEVTKKDADGNITEIQCSVSGVFLPATVEYFYEDKNGKGINGLKRLSRQAEAVRKTHIKQLNATEKALMTDIFDGKLTPEDGKVKLAEAKAKTPDYSVVGIIVPAEQDEQTA